MLLSKLLYDLLQALDLTLQPHGLPLCLSKQLLRVLQITCLSLHVRLNALQSTIHLSLVAVEGRLEAREGRVKVGRGWAKAWHLLVHAGEAEVAKGLESRLVGGGKSNQLLDFNLEVLELLFYWEDFLGVLANSPGLESFDLLLHCNQSLAKWITTSSKLLNLCPQGIELILNHYNFLSVVTYSCTSSCHCNVS